MVPHRHARRHHDRARRPRCASSACSSGRSSRTRPGVDLVPDPRRGPSGEIWRLVTWPLANEPHASGPSSPSPSSGTSAREIEGLLGRNRFAVLLLAPDRHPGARRRRSSTSRMFGLDAGRARRVPGLRRRVPVRPLLLRHPGVGDRRRHRRHRGAAVPRRPPTERRLVLLFVTIAVAGVTARSDGPRPEPAVDPRRSRSAGSAAAAAARRSGRRRAQRRRRRRRRRAVRRRRGASRPAAPPLPQPPRAGGDAADQAELDALLDKISGRRHGRPHAPTRSGASTSSPSACATVADRPSTR